MDMGVLVCAPWSVWVSWSVLSVIVGVLVCCSVPFKNPGIRQSLTYADVIWKTIIAANTFHAA